MYHQQWDPTYVIWMIVFIVVCGAAWLTFIVAGAVAIRTRGNRGWGTLIGALCVAIIGGAIGTLIAFPFSGQYHRFKPVSGTVTAVGSRFLGDGSGGTNQKFVVTIDGQPWAVNDTRASQLVKGDRVLIYCERAWQWQGTPGWDCNWGNFLGGPQR